MTDYHSTQPQDQEDPGGADLYNQAGDALLGVTIAFLIILAPLGVILPGATLGETQLQTEHVIAKPL